MLRANSPPVADRKPLQFQAQQPLFLNLHVNLTNPVVKQAMKYYISALSTIYQQNWRPTTAEDDGLTFIELIARTPKMLPSWIRRWELDTDPEAEHYHMECHAEACYIWEEDDDSDGSDWEVEGEEEDEEVPANELASATYVHAFENLRRLSRARAPGNANATGVRNGDGDRLAHRDPRARFTATVTRHLMFKNMHIDDDFVWYRTYSAPPLPVEPRSNEEED